MAPETPIVSSSQAAKWAHFSHDADIGICGEGRSLEQAFEQAALAMTAVVTSKPVQAHNTVDIRCHAPDRETLFFDWLNALVFEMATGDVLFCRFAVDIDHADGWTLEATVQGEPVDIRRHEPTVEIKGATYTELAVDRNDDGTWRARCVLDV